MALCEACDLAVATELQGRAIRDAAERADSRLRRSGLPYDYRSGKRVLGVLPASAAKVLDTCRMLGADIRGLYLWGPARTYKTSIAASWLASQIKTGATGLYASAVGITTDILASYRSDDAESRGTVVKRLIEAPCLVIDDLGKERASEHAAGVWFEILDGRFNAAGKGHWMIVTSNYAMDAICNRFDAPKEVTEPIRHRLSVLCLDVPMAGRK